MRSGIFLAVCGMSILLIGYTSNSAARAEKRANEKGCADRAI
jgi:hypothetical protein